MALVLGDKEGILMTIFGTATEFLPHNSLTCIVEVFKAKLHEKLQKKVLFLQDNAATHRTGKTMNVLKNLGFECLDYPLCSPDFTFSGYFPVFKA